MSAAKDYLQQIKRLDNLIECQSEEVTRLREMLTRITPVMSEDGASGGGFRDKISDGIAKVVDLQNEINKNVDEYADTKAHILHVLKKMKNADSMTVLYKRYFKYLPWEEIASEMKYTCRGVCYLHGRALLEFEKAMKDEEKESGSHGKENDA